MKTEICYKIQKSTTNFLVINYVMIHNKYQGGRMTTLISLELANERGNNEHR